MDTLNILHNSLEMPITSRNGFTSLSTHPDCIMMDPQLGVSFPGNLNETIPEPSFTVSPSIGNTQLATQIAFLSQAGAEPHVAENNSDAATVASYGPYGSATTKKSSHRLSHPSNQFTPSDASFYPSHINKRTRRYTRMKPQQQQLSPPEESWDVDEGVKHTRHLERNRVAASKCRQKKKEWVHDLAETKGVLETKHKALQQEYITLLDDKNQIGSLLMAHARCNDQNIDQWVELEARKFVQKSSNDADALTRRMSETKSASVSDDQYQGMHLDQL